MTVSCSFSRAVLGTKTPRRCVVADAITAIQNETKQAVDRMTRGADRVQEGVVKAQEAGTSLEEIVASADQVAGMIQSIAAASEQQSATSEQVARNVEQISVVTNQATQGTIQAASSASDLSRKSEQLLAFVGRFVVRESGVDPTRSAAQPLRGV